MNVNMLYECKYTIYLSAVGAKYSRLAFSLTLLYVYSNIQLCSVLAMVPSVDS